MWIQNRSFPRDILSYDTVRGSSVVERFITCISKRHVSSLTAEKWQQLLPLIFFKIKKVMVSHYNLITQFYELSLSLKGNKILDFYIMLEVFVFFPGNVKLAVCSVQVPIATSLFLYTNASEMAA